MSTAICPSCRENHTVAFYEVDRAPVHCARLVPTRTEAVECAKGPIRLRVCRLCGFIYNASFDPALLDYSHGYESTQAYSGTFDAFQRRLVAELVERYDIRGRRVVDVGCGSGEFLRLLCEVGRNRGTGFDPAYEGRDDVANGPDWSVDFVREDYSDGSTTEPADLLSCRMTLEHVRDVADFIRLAHRGVGGRSSAMVFVQVPDVDRVLHELAFWDIYYEHCSYFGEGSLRSLFERNGFMVHALWREYSNQYLMVMASPSERTHLRRGDDIESHVRLAERFGQEQEMARRGWKHRLAAWSREGRRTILWGGGSKAVAFLHAVDGAAEVDCVVDINPRKQHTYLPGTGHAIVAPSSLRDRRPDVVLVMNPIYLDEVRRELTDLQIVPELIGLDQ